MAANGYEGFVLSPSPKAPSRPAPAAGKAIDLPHLDQQRVDAAVETALANLLDGNGEQGHLARALVAERLAAVAAHRVRAEVAAARDRDGASWEDVGQAFGVSSHDAHERFRTSAVPVPL